MELTKELMDTHQLKLTVTLEAEQIDKAKHSAARKIAKKIKIPGFRPGKAPYNIVERTVGEGSILEEALDLLLKEIYPKAIEQAEVDPYGAGTLIDSSLEEFTFTFTVPLPPEVELGDYQDIRLPYELPEIEDAAIQDFVERIRQQNATVEPAEHPAQPGDLVYLVLDSNRTNPKEDEDPALIKDQRFPLLMASPEDKKDEQDEAEDDWPIPGFSHYILGMSAGEEKTFTYTYPDDHQYENLQGVEVEFHVVVEEVKERALPELDDEFAQSVGEFETMDELTAHVGKLLTDQANTTYNKEYQDKVLDQVTEQAVIKFPPQLLADEIDTMIDELTHRLSHEGMDLTAYLKAREIDMDGLREEVSESAEHRLKRSLVVYEVSKREDIQINEEEMQQEVNVVISSLLREMPQKEAAKFLKDKQSINSVVSSVMSDAYTKNTLIRLQAIASGEAERQAEEAKKQAEEAAKEEEPAVEEATPTETSSAPEETSAENPEPEETETQE